MTRARFWLLVWLCAACTCALALVPWACVRAVRACVACVREATVCMSVPFVVCHQRFEVGVHVHVCVCKALSLHCVCKPCCVGVP